MNNEPTKNIKLKATFDGMKIPWEGDSEKRAVVLMSGGVDSSAAALILLREGYAVAGLTMKISRGTEQPACESAACVCRALSIPHFSVDVGDEFKSMVSSPFCRAYTLGMTPNPCADCNEQIKFGLLWDIAEREWGGSFDIATGHYAQILHRDGRAYLARALDLKKDQSYFMSGIRPERIGRIRLPLGSFTSKEEVRMLVRAAGLSVAERQESMEICFAGENDYRSLFGTLSRPGPIKDISGKVIGTHKGITGYTLGQRKGLGIAAAQPLFVVEIRPFDNTIIVAPKDAAFCNEVYAEDVNILAPDIIAEGVRLYGKIRSQGEPQPCFLLSNCGGNISVRFDAPVFAPAPGQRLVLYTGDGIVAAGGVIIN